MIFFRKSLAAAVLIATISAIGSDVESPIFNNNGIKGKGSSTAVVDKAPDDSCLAINWQHAESNKVLSIEPEIRDWSEYDTIHFKMYSGRADQDAFTVVIYSDQDNKKNNYYLQQIKVDWKGWKEFNIPFSQFNRCRKPVGWNKINSISFNSLGWGLKAKPGMQLAIADLKLLKTKLTFNDLAKRGSVVSIPINPAEAIISPLWDPNISDLGKYQVTGGRANQTWCFVDLSWSPKKDLQGIVFDRNLDLDCSGYDTLIVTIALPTNTQLSIKADTDTGLHQEKFTIQAGSFTFSATPGRSKKTEYALKLQGAKKISRITFSVNSDKPGSGILKWIGLQSSAKLKVWDSYWNDMKKIDLSPYLNNEVTPSYNSTLKIFCGEIELDNIRTRLHASPRDMKTFTDWGQKMLKMPAPEARIREFATGDPRFIRDCDAGSGCLHDSSGAAWVGTILKDPALLRLAAKRAIILAMTPKWGESIYANMPGTSWEHRCFTESYSVLDIAFTLDFAGDFLSKAGKDLLLRVLSERGLGTINFNAWKYDYIYKCNQLIAFSPGRIGGYALLEKSGWSHVHPYTDLAFNELISSVPENFEDDGGFHEGPAYFQYTLWGALPSCYTYARLRNKSFDKILPGKMKALPSFADLMVSTDEDYFFIPLNDCSGKHGLSINSISFLSVMFPESQFVRLYNRYVKKEPLPAGQYWTWIIGAHIPKHDPPYKPFIMIPSMASAASVRDLDGAKLKVVLLGDASGGAHKHQDAGSFIIEYAGETLAMDSNGCSYASPFCNEIRRGDRHNVMLPVDSSILGNSKSLKPLPFNAKGDSVGFSAEIDLQPCWRNVFSTRTRKLDSPTPGTLSITDKWQRKKGNGVIFYWLTTCRIRIEGRKVSIDGKRATATFNVPDGWDIATEELTREGNTPQQRLSLKSSENSGSLKLDIAFSKIVSDRNK